MDKENVTIRLGHLRNPRNQGSSVKLSGVEQRSKFPDASTICRPERFDEGQNQTLGFCPFSSTCFYEGETSENQEEVSYLHPAGFLVLLPNPWRAAFRLLYSTLGLCCSGKGSPLKKKVKSTSAPAKAIRKGNLRKDDYCRQRPPSPPSFVNDKMSLHSRPHISPAIVVSSTLLLFTRNGALQLDPVRRPFSQDKNQKRPPQNLRRGRLRG